MALVRPLSRPNMRPLLGLPPALRHSLYQQQQQNGVRHFSYQGIASSLDASAVVSIFPATAMEVLHTIGLPWFMVFPLSAVLIRSCFVYPLFLKPLRKTKAEQISNAPLVDAKLSVLRRSFARVHVRKPISRVEMVWRRWQAQTYLSKTIFGRTSIPYKRGASFLTLIAASDAIRRLCGLKQGLLQFILGPFDWVASWMFRDNSPVVAPPVAPASPAATSSASVSTVDLPFANEFEKQGSIDPATDTTMLDHSPVEQVLQEAVAKGTINIDSPWFDPSIMTGGYSWATDLTASDPTLILPFLFSGSFFASIYYSPRLTGEGGGPGKATNMQRIGMSVALLSIFPALQMPVALLLYYTTNIWVGVFQTRWLAYTIPFRPSPLACKRPVRTQPMKELSDEIEEPSARKIARAIR